MPDSQIVEFAPTAETLARRAYRALQSHWDHYCRVRCDAQTAISGIQAKITVVGGRERKDGTERAVEPIFACLQDINDCVLLATEAVWSAHVRNVRQQFGDHAVAAALCALNRGINLS